MPKTGLKAPKDRSESKSPIKSLTVPMPYDKENLPLRPLLRKHKNVEDNVHTMRVQEENYLMINEDQPRMVDNVSLPPPSCNCIGWLDGSAHYRNTLHGCEKKRV